MSTRQMKRRIKKIAKTALRFIAQPKITEGQLVEHFLELGLASGDSVLVHSSLSSAGRIEHGAEGVIESLMKVVGPTGTLLFPTHNWREVNRGLRKFDVRNSPSLVGAISECFRLRDDVIRSEHPSHSVAAWGKDAARFTANHLACDSPCGAKSPYHKLIMGSGKILLFGVGLERNTCFHCVESLANCSYLSKAESDRFEIIDSSGESRFVDIRCHATAIPSRFSELEQDLEAVACVRSRPIGKSRSTMIDAKAFHDWLLPKLLANPHFLLKPRGNFDA
ncbi:AAC(3) family N-acetyltransferase [Allorhodopirellula heiligendammensis]|uniref:Aminoglycoside N(3)-acetyltransferase n=1 Tax=Allorhodopirellula heiligendammensis TaxID=2714739 RepID=A0A5C6C796_9BACT|nr:SPBc2 prophage-derived aminoglycoside N(3')-acetyltransferase-like protein YokD [Allorhodopirellula heiligendammensis]